MDSPPLIFFVGGNTISFQRTKQRDNEEAQFGL
jgi:hypothetical protein